MKFSSLPLGEKNRKSSKKLAEYVWTSDLLLSCQLETLTTETITYKFIQFVALKSFPYKMITHIQNYAKFLFKFQTRQEKP